METERVVSWLLVVGLVGLYVRRQQQAFSWPLTGSLKITSGFGVRTAPTAGASTYHTGVDLSAVIDTPVYASAAGTVTSIYTNADGGKQLLIQHDNGFTSGYAHLNRYAVTTGQRVGKRQLVAYSGNTGKTTGPHLHFSLKDASGQFVDPLTYLS